MWEQSDYVAEATQFHNIMETSIQIVIGANFSFQAGIGSGDSFKNKAGQLPDWFWNFKFKINLWIYNVYSF